MKGILLDENGDLYIVPRKTAEGVCGLRIADTTIQDASIVIGLNQGELKGDPVLGPNLQRYIRSNSNQKAIERVLKIHLERAGIRFSSVHEFLSIKLNRI